MEKNNRMKKNTKSDKDQKPHRTPLSSEPEVDNSPALDADQSPLRDTSFHSRLKKHAAILSRIPFSVQRQEYIMHLNNTHGLRYVQRLLESVNAQAELTVSNPGDIYEQEADKVADEVTREINNQAQRQDEEEELQMMPDLRRQTENEEEEELLQAKLDVQRQDEEEELQMMPDLRRQTENEEEEEELIQAKLDVQKQDEEEELQMMPDLQRQPENEEEEELLQAKLNFQRQDEEEELQMKRDEKGESVVANEIELRIDSSKGSGHPLSSEVKKPMEQAFGVGFNDVKIHTDTESDSLNKQLNAKAFTTGTDIFFRDGEYNPDSDGGKKLIAHELTHVVQQTGGRPGEGSSNIRSKTGKDKSNSNNPRNK